MRGVIVPIIALYNWDNTILDGLKVPTNADLDPNIEYISNHPTLSSSDLREELLAQLGEMTPVYNKPDIFKRQVEVWARIHKPEWTKLWQSTIYKYNPIWNKDGTYTETLDRSGNNTGKSSGSNSGKDTTGYGRVDTHNVTGYDTNSFSPSSQDVAGGSDTRNSSGSYSDNSSGSYADKQTLTRTEHGNIGVTTTQQMMKEERETAVFNVYDFIIEAFKERFCIMIY